MASLKRTSAGRIRFSGKYWGTHAENLGEDSTTGPLIRSTVLSGTADT